MRLGNLDGRAVLGTADQRAVDVEEVSGGRFGPDPQATFDNWPEFVAWADTVDLDDASPIDRADLGPPVPRPSQVFAIGVNYADHAREAGYAPDSLPVTFTKFPTCLIGPHAEVELPSSTVDWEVELVVAIGAPAHRVARKDGWAHVAGLTVGQDLSERTSQLAGAKPQFSLAKSYRGFGPTGPWLVTPEELPNPADLRLSCSVNGAVMQSGRTSQMIYDVPELVARLSSVCDLLPGDLIFTGTPAGVGNAREPKLFLRPGDRLESSIEGLGSIRQTFLAAH